MEYTQLRSIPAHEDAPVARLYQLHALSIMTYVRRHIHSREDAEDIVLEVFLAALEHTELPTLSEQKQLAWLQRVAYHKCVDYHRRSARRPAVALDGAAETLMADERQNPDRLAVRNEEDALLRERLNQLPEHYQAVIQLRFANGLRCTEIASRLHKSEGAIRMVLSRALNILRDFYARQ